MAIENAIHFAVDPATIAFLASSAMQIWGQSRQSREQKRAANINQRMYRKQQELSTFQTKRKVRMQERESQAFIGKQVSALASSSPGFLGAESKGRVTKAKQIAEKERALMKKQGQIENEILSIKAKQAARRAQAADQNQLFGTLSTIFSTGANILNNTDNSPSGLTQDQSEFINSDPGVGSNFSGGN